MEPSTDPNFDINDFKHDPLLLTEEGIHRYCPGGLHPVSLGDQFEFDRYTVVHKLGYGEFATVWLAKDKGWYGHCSGHEWVALKILAAHSEEPSEIRNMQYLKDKSNDALFRKCIVNLIHVFVFEGPNGLHSCMVLELVGPSFELIQQSYIDFNNYGHYLEFGNTEFSNSDHYLEIECPVIIRSIRQILTALKFMQDLKMCHGGISSANIAFVCPNRLRNADEQKVFEVMGSPQMVPLERKDGVPLGKGLPKELIQSAQWTGYLDEDQYSIRLIGFGKSFLHGDEPDNLKQPVHLRCPESIMGDKLDYRLDLWYAGCFIYQLLMSEPPFPGSSDNYEHLKSIIGFVEDLPVEWESKMEELRLISEQNRALEKSQVTEKETMKDLEATEGTRPDAQAPTDVLVPDEEGPAAGKAPVKDDKDQHISPNSQRRTNSTLSPARPLRRSFDKKANNPMLAPLLPIMDGLLRFRPSDRVSIVRKIMPPELVAFPAQDEYHPLVVDTTEDERELSNSDEQSNTEITITEPQESPECASDLPGNHDQQQPPVLDVCSTADKDQSEAQTDLLNDRHDHRPVAPGISKNAEQDQLEVADRASDLVHSHREQQPEISEIPEGFNQPRLETTEDAAASSDDSEKQEPGSRKRLRSRLGGGLLGHRWRPWKRRRNS
ncbi:unnamed protein product [Penicillium glandicola]